MSKTTNIPGQSQRFVIVGDGLDAWMTAAALAGKLNTDECSITVIGRSRPGDTSGPFAHADATIPWPDNLPEVSGLDEDNIIKQSDGCFSFGVALSGWVEPNATYFHPFGSIGAALGPVAFHHLALRLRKEGLPVRFANFSLAAMAAQAGRFEKPGTDARSVVSTCRYGLHLDINKQTEIQRRLAETAGVVLSPGTFTDIEQHEDGALSAVLTSNGDRVEGDLFLDCSGIHAHLIGTVKEAQWQDWSAWLPCDHIVTASADTPHAPPVYSHAEAHAGGWIQHLPLNTKTVMNGLYNANAITADGMLEKLQQCSGCTDLGNIQESQVRFGRRAKPWHRNCVALGGAAAMIDPLAVTNLQLLRLGINRLLRLLPGGKESAAVSAEYNRQTTMQLDHARDFALLHYRLNDRHGVAFWDACRELPIPEPLDYRLSLYRNCGLLAQYDEEPLDETSWLNLLDENGVHPDRYSPIASGFSQQDLQNHLQRVRTVMLKALQSMPTHAEYLARLTGHQYSSQGGGTT